MAKGQSAFGHGQLAQQLAIRLRHHFSDDKADASLVIGIFGEWGSGKSNLLQLVHDQFGELPQSEGKKEGGKNTPPVIVVPFNPWRYEKEEHLIAPLFKTMQVVLNRHIEQNKSYWEKLGLLPTLKRAVVVTGKLALALVKGFKGKFTASAGNEITGKIEAAFEVDAEKIRDEAARAFEKAPEPEKPPLETLESFYYDFETHLRALTAGENSFRLLFLIDDLDRCLPEKAVEMLELIKLFLDVEGCAFVLAVDDEVVERGIIHRYREYIFQGVNGANASKPLAQMPITGMEYLEKIIHLPFRLFLPSRAEIRAFLKGIPAYADLFGAPVEEGSEAPRLRMGGDNEELLKLFSEHIPPVPRKQLRAADLLLLQLEMAKARGCAHRIKPLPLAKLIILQLFAPDLYRFGRRHNGFMNNLQAWEREHPGWGRNIQYFEQSLEAKIAEQLDETIRTSELCLLDRIYKPLIHALENAAHSRSGFDPFRLIREMPFSSDDLTNLHHYFSFVEDSPAIIVQVPAIELGQDTGQPTVSSRHTRMVSRLSNPSEFLDLLFSISPANWQSAVQLPEVAGHMLDEAVFLTIQERLDKEAFASFLCDREWLGLVVPLLNGEQFNWLAKKSTLGNLLSKGEWEERAALMASLRVEQRQKFQGEVSKLQKMLLAKAQSDKESMAVRARAGHLLGDSGWLPNDLDAMIPINEGSFLRGEKKEKAQIDKDYWIGKYPVTNAQYRRFIDAKGYEKKNFWSEKGWAWRQGENIQFPEYWDDRKWANPLSPVAGVSYYEAEAYCRWSQSQMRENPAAYGLPEDKVGTLHCRLPSNDEWERAARGEDGWVYPWEGEFFAAKANCLESWASADKEEHGTTAVITFPQGKSPAGLFDCAGNVWEWMSPNHKNGAPNLRGGAWDILAYYLRCAFHGEFHPGERDLSLGFRLVFGS